MRQISRNIYHHFADDKDIYYFKYGGHIKGIYFTLGEALNRRKKEDFQKKEWKPYNKEGYLTKPFRSYIQYDSETGLYYSQVSLDGFEILVSDRYKFEEAHEVQRYLDKEKWSLKALNQLKMIGVDACRDYAGILPLKEGYLIIDSEHNEWGLKQTLKEAVEYRNTLRRDGVVI
jgi:hypothetical protein